MKRLRIAPFSSPILLFGLIAAVVLSAAAQQPRVPAPAEKLKAEGLPNLGRVTPTLYRGGQPEKAGYEKLKALGIEIVVNFRNEKDKIRAERKRVEALGMRFVSIPWSGSDKPDNRQVAEFLDLVRSNPDRKIFAHCRRGAERTGVMLAAYRIAYDDWTAEQALAEMEEFKFLGFWFRHLKQYVRDFKQTLEIDPALRKLSLAAAGTTP